LFADDCRRSKHDPSVLELKCTYCGRYYSPSINQISNRIRSTADNAKYVDIRLYCSTNCKQSCPMFSRTVDQLINVDAKINSETSIPLNREIQAQLRQMVLARDNYTCQKCGKHQDNLDVGLHAHRIEGIRHNPIESADIDMVITVCVNCHKEIHRQPGCTRQDMMCNLEDYDEDTMNKIKKNKEIKKQDIDKVEDIEINISNEMLEDILFY